MNRFDLRPALVTVSQNVPIDGFSNVNVSVAGGPRHLEVALPPVARQCQCHELEPTITGSNLTQAGAAAAAAPLKSESQPLTEPKAGT